MATQEQNPHHFVMLPLMAQGHMIPMVDIARLLARRGLTVTILTTPLNAARYQPAIDLAAGDLKIHVLKFPSVEAGLPEGCENLDMVASAEDSLKFFDAVAMLKDQVEKLLLEMNPPPTCLVADMWMVWATAVARKLKIPRLLFHGTSCFSLLCHHILGTSDEFKNLPSDSDPFVVPGVPDRIVVTRAQHKGTSDLLSPEWIKKWNQLRESEVGAFGTIANSFQELEPQYVDGYMRVTCRKAWCIGPVSLCNRDDSDKAVRGNKSSISEHECLKWLDSQKPRSVIYVCLGTLAHLDAPQLMELGLGLEASNLPFVSVVGNPPEEFQTWVLQEKFEERNEGRGLLIHGWAPQTLILSHSSIGGFLTHCGWNSTLEGITAGVPMVTWPLFSEQFYNEKFIVEVIKIGVRIGVEVPVFFGAGVMGAVKSGEIKGVIERLMDGGEEGGERRKRAEKLGEMARMAVAEGGSSCRNLTSLIDDVIEQKANICGEETMLKF